MIARCSLHRAECKAQSSAIPTGRCSAGMGLACPTRSKGCIDADYRALVRTAGHPRIERTDQGLRVAGTCGVVGHAVSGDRSWAASGGARGARATGQHRDRGRRGDSTRQVAGLAARHGGVWAPSAWGGFPVAGRVANQAVLSARGTDKSPRASISRRWRASRGWCGTPPFATA